MSARSKWPTPSVKDLMRFLVKVGVGGRDECWPWLASCDKDGYGQFAYAGTMCKAHQLSFEWVGGSALVAGLWLLHKCDNPPCCNPAHHYQGTHSENCRDVVERGRQRGSRNGHAKLDEVTAQAVLDLACSSSQLEASTRYGISQAQVCRIVHGRQWPHLRRHT